MTPDLTFVTDHLALGGAFPRESVPRLASDFRIRAVVDLREEARDDERWLARHGIAPGQVAHVIHGTTLVANALIERRGVRTGFLTTAGFRDVQEIGTCLLYTSRRG